MEQYDFNLFADYFQFYLEDDEARPDSPVDVSDEDVRARFKVAPQIVVVYTARNMTVPVHIGVYDREPTVELEIWDPIVDCNLSIPSGRIIVAGCTDYLPKCARIAVPPADYRARVLYRDLDALSEDGLEGDDHYRIELCPGSPRETRVVKRYVERGSQ